MHRDQGCVTNFKQFPFSRQTFKRAARTNSRAVERQKVPMIVPEQWNLTKSKNNTGDSTIKLVKKEKRKREQHRNCQRSSGQGHGNSVRIIHENK